MDQEKCKLENLHKLDTKSLIQCLTLKHEQSTPPLKLDPPRQFVPYLQARSGELDKYFVTFNMRPRS